ncbi:MAG: hypothetical protein ABIM89_02775 [Mycobacteriales bacterium]
MPDLDQLLDNLVADVRSKTRAPGASPAIKQAHRRRKVVVAVGAVAAVAVIAAGSVLAAGTLGGSGGKSSVARPPTASPEPPALPEAAIGERYRTLRKTLTSAPGWAVTDGAVPDYTFLVPCGGDWSAAGGGAAGAGHNLGLSVSRDEPPVAWAEELEGFPSPAQASNAMDQLVRNLASCTAESWRSQPIGQTGAVLAFSDAGVLWIAAKGASVATLAVATTDGPPPLAVQVEVAHLIYSWFV